VPNYKSAVTSCALLLLTLVLHGPVIAQSEEAKLEVGAQFSVIGRGAGGVATSIGGGGKLTFNLTKYLALEGELNYFPSAGFNDVRRFPGQFGVKSGLRFDRFGVFGKVRPGFIDTKYDFRTFCLSFPCPPGAVCITAPCFPATFTVANTDLSLDVGGVVEFYPSKLVTVRLDVGDTVVNR
jgi:outer membrane protein with beta-barrel domain